MSIYSVAAVQIFSQEATAETNALYHCEHIHHWRSQDSKFDRATAISQTLASALASPAKAKSGLI